MYKIFALNIFLPFLIFTTKAQELIHKCATDEYHEIQKHKKQSYQKLYEPQIENKDNLRIENNATVVIPVVVHVIYNSSTTNISDEQVISQIEVLNKDFRAQNADTGKVPEVFKNLIADVGFEFCLAKRDPFGNPTNGITRTETNRSFFTVSGDEAKFDNTGGKNIWDRNRYLNIWVVPSLRATATSSSTTLGYAEYPGGPENIDGVVIIHRAFGTLGSAQSPFNAGRTTTHEIGHWFGLFHTFQGGCVGTSNATCGTLGDRVCDTPPVSDPTFGCPTTSKNTCTETPTDRIDMTMNFMDYVNDNCMQLFTHGQKNRMISFLNNTRQSLKTSDACLPPLIPQLNLSLTGLKVKENNCNPLKNFLLELTNNGIDNIESFELSFFEDNELLETQNFSISIQSGEKITVELTEILINKKGQIEFSAIINKVNGRTDDKNNDNQALLSLNIPYSTQLPFDEGFEFENDLQKWTIINPDNGFTWERIITISPNGSHAMYVNNFDYEGGNGLKDDLISPTFTIGASGLLTFNYAYRLYTPLTESTLYSDTLVMLYQEDCSGDKIELGRWDALDLTTGEPYYLEDPYFPSLSDWKTKRINLSELQGKNIQLIFRNVSDHENNLFIDNISVTSVNSLIDNQYRKNVVYLKNNSLNWITDFKVTDLEVYDILGKTWLKKKVSNLNSIFLGDLNKGMFLVKLSGSGQVLTKKFVIE
ncbi:MAG: M43 family zinc metalloprotease [Cytophagales bacterium]